MNVTNKSIVVANSAGAVQRYESEVVSIGLCQGINTGDRRVIPRGIYSAVGEKRLRR